MLIFIETIAVLFIFYVILRYVFIIHAINIPKPIALVILIVGFLVLPAPIKAMLLIIAIIAFVVWLAFYIEYNSNQSKLMKFIREWF